MIYMDERQIVNQWKSVLRLVKKGQCIGVMQGNKVIAELHPTPVQERKRAADAIKAMEEFQRKGPTLGPGLTIRKLIEEGRKY